MAIMARHLATNVADHTVWASLGRVSNGAFDTITMPLNSFRCNLLIFCYELIFLSGGALKGIYVFVSDGREINKIVALGR